MLADWRIKDLLTEDKFGSWWTIVRAVLNVFTKEDELALHVASDELEKVLRISYRQVIALFLDKSVVIFDKNKDKVQN